MCLREVVAVRVKVSVFRAIRKVLPVCSVDALHPRRGIEAPLAPLFAMQLCGHLPALALVTICCRCHCLNASSGTGYALTKRLK